MKCFVISYFHRCILPVILIPLLSFSLSSHQIWHPSVCLYSPCHPSLSSPVLFCLTRSDHLFSTINSFSTSVYFNLCECHSGLLLLPLSLYHAKVTHFTGVFIQISITHLQLQYNAISCMTIFISVILPDRCRGR